MNRPLKIVFISEMFSEKMGYAENFLPKAVAHLGHEVHLIASTAQIYFNSRSYKKTYAPFIGPRIVSAGVKQIDGYTLYRLPLKPRIPLIKAIRMKGLSPLLEKIQPDIIQVFNIYSISCFQAAKTAKKLGIKFFTESHIHASVFDMHNFRTRLKYQLLRFPDKLREINQITIRHYPIGKDVAQLSVQYFYVSPDKIEIQSLGVDTRLFTPLQTREQEEARTQLRKKLKIAPTDFICIYTGRFSEDKNPQCLARAIAHLQEKGDVHIKGLFVGNGTDKEIKEIASLQGCIVHPFVKVTALPDFYRLADIAVWPRQESLSQLDAAACGLPLILSNRIAVKERVQGNGLLYQQDNPTDLAEQIKKLTPADFRQHLAVTGTQKVVRNYSWEAVARKRVMDYEQSLLNTPSQSLQ